MNKRALPTTTERFTRDELLALLATRRKADTPEGSSSAPAPATLYRGFVPSALSVRAPLIAR